MPEGAVYVGRPSRWGNPFKSAIVFRHALEIAIENGEFYDLCEFTERHINGIAKSIELLHGKQLACWCPLDRPCHADALAELAN